MERFKSVLAGILLSLSILRPVDVCGSPRLALALRYAGPGVSTVTTQTQTSESVLPAETRTQIDKLASRAAKELRKHRKGPAGWNLLVMDFPFVDSGKITELGVLLADEFSDSLSRQAEGFAVLSRSQIVSILKEEEIPRESLRESEIALYVAKKAGADEPLKGFLVRGADGNLILSVSVFEQKMERLDATLTTTDGMRGLLAKEMRPPEPKAEPIEAEPGVFVAGKEGVTLPTCIYCPIPQYSDLARKMHYSWGDVRLSVIVTAEGTAEAIKVIQGAPFGLTKQAISAVQSWKFKPAEKDGKPVPVRTSVEITFRLALERPSREPGLSAGSEAQTPVHVFRPGQDGVGYPRCEHCPNPDYSDDARRAKVTGFVALQVVITAEGKAGEIKVVQGLGYGLTEEAIKAVRKWRFKPATGPDGTPVAVISPVEVTFRLK